MADSVTINLAGDQTSFVADNSSGLRWFRNTGGESVAI